MCSAARPPNFPVTPEKSLAGTRGHGGVAYVCFEQARAHCATATENWTIRSTRADASAIPAPWCATCNPGECGTPGYDFQRWVERLHIEHILDRGLRYISTGEMRKTLLIRAILSGPALLILDSPLDGLDLAGPRKRCAKVIGELHAVCR